MAESQVIKARREEARITCAPGLTCTVFCAAARGSLELAMQAESYQDLHGSDEEGIRWSEKREREIIKVGDR